VRKILILTNSIGGLYYFRKELVQELLKEKHEVYISAPMADKTAYFIQIGCKYINTFIDRRSLNPIRDFVLFISYLKILKSVNPDVVLTYTIKPNIYGGIACQIFRI
jgi:hypothetical protein